MVHLDEGLFTGYVPVIVGPTSNNGIELEYQMARRSLFVGL